MITTRRSDTNSISAFANDSSRAGVAVLERKEPASYQEYVAPQAPAESSEEAKARMQENLAKLLNYDRYAEVKDSVASPVADAVVVENQAPTSQVEVAQEATKVSEEDIRPTSTTMQFGESDMQNLRNEMRRENKEDSESKYKLNSKGKLVVVLYSLVITVVLALIAINSGVLAKLSATEQAYSEQITEQTQVLNEKQTEILEWSSEENIVNKAQEIGMIK